MPTTKTRHTLRLLGVWPRNNGELFPVNEELGVHVDDTCREWYGMSILDVIKKVWPHLVVNDQMRKHYLRLDALGPRTFDQEILGRPLLPCNNYEPEAAFKEAPCKNCGFERLRHKGETTDRPSMGCQVGVPNLFGPKG